MQHGKIFMKQDVENIDRLLGWESLPELAQWVIEKAIEIQQIPAPTFQEGKRAAFVAEQFEALKLAQVHTDDMCNVYGWLPGRVTGQPAILVSAHTDTVFSETTDLSIRHEGGYIYGPGLGDNSIGIAGLMGLVHYLKRREIYTESGIWFVATSREEGLGDLGGMRAVYARFKGQVSRVINLEGLAFGHVYHAGIAVRRLRITAGAAGGHSWLHFGRPSAIHALMRLGNQITQLQPPQEPRTTFNIGMIDGGESINSIATSAELWLDLRSESPSALTALETQVRQIVSSLASSDLTFQIEVVGDRPAGQLPPDHELVQAALTSLSLVGVRGSLETGSTDANVPLAAGCPAVTVGITRGGNAHRLDEYIETRSIALGLRQLVILTLAAAGYSTSQK
jgi:tripeptide aminopeptidase